MPRAPTVNRTEVDNDLRELVIPQPRDLQVVSLVIACLCLSLGVLRGSGGHPERQVIWYVAAAVWLGLYFWRRWVPYLRLTEDCLVVTPSPFSYFGAWSTVPFEFERTDEAFEISYDEFLHRIPLDRIPVETRDEIEAGLGRIQALAAEYDAARHKDFVEEWGIDPCAVEPWDPTKVEQDRIGQSALGVK